MKTEEILKDFIDQPGGLVIPHGLSISAYYEEVRMEKRKSLFPLIVRLETRERNVEIAKMRKYDLIQMAVQRVVFRFLVFLRDGGHLAATPLDCMQWISPTNEMATMYTPDMFFLSKWEIENCPWWMDMIKGKILEHERERYKEIYHDLPKEPPQSILETPGPRKRANRGGDPNLDLIQWSVQGGVDSNVQENDPQGVSAQVNIVKKVNTFIFVEKHVQSSFVQNQDHGCLAIVGDYVTIGKDFASGMKNSAYTKVHEQFKSKCSNIMDYVRVGCTMAWAADLVFLDLPFGGLHGAHPHPQWDRLIEDHVRYRISVGATSLSDRGWMLVVRSSSAGPSVGWVERYARVSNLEIWHRVLVCHDSSYGYLELADCRVECSTSMLFMIRR